MKEDIARLLRAVFGEQVGDYDEPGLMSRMRKVEKRTMITLALVAVAAAYAVGIPTQDIGPFIKGIFLAAAEAAGLHH